MPCYVNPNKIICYISFRLTKEEIDEGRKEYYKSKSADKKKKQEGKTNERD